MCAYVYLFMSTPMLICARGSTTNLKEYFECNQHQMAIVCNGLIKMLTGVHDQYIALMKQDHGDPAEN